MSIAILKLPSFRRSQRSFALTNYLPVWFVLVIGIAISATLAGTAYQWERAKTREKYARRADAIALSLQRNLDDAENVARAVAGLYTVSDRVSRDEFARFSQQILRNATGILSIGFAPRIPARDRPNYEQQQGQPIWEWASQNEGEALEKIPAGDRADYYPTTYIEPFN
ncbi:MAG: CHASE domain-containing protein, partial [Cyanobacteriota bacterium]|nr:CHASE domain-containing protein [Cyanobacteriota bacterium]